MPAEKNKQRVLLYARVSTELPAEEGQSIAAQLSEMREFAARRGWPVVAEFTDAGLSGATTERPGLAALRQAVTDSLADIVLVHALSRLSHSIFESLTVFDEFGRAGVGFASATEPDFDFTAATGRNFLTTFSTVNRYYLDLLKSHPAPSRPAQTNAALAPYGYRTTGQPDTPPAIDPTEAPAVQLAFETYAAGKSSYQEIADLLNERGYRPRSGRRFAKEVVDDILHNPFYAGLVVYRAQGAAPEVSPGQHEALISREMFETCQALMQQRRGALRAAQPGLETYLLNDLATCAVCGRKLRAQKLQATRYYRERTHEPGFSDCPYARSGAPADPLEAQVEAIFRALRLPEDWQAEIAAQLNQTGDIEVLTNQRQQLKAELLRLRTAYIKGHFEADPDAEAAYDRQMAELKRQLEMLPETDLAAIEAAAEQLQQVGDVWDEADLPTKRELIQLILADLALDIPQGRVVSLTPYAPFQPLFRQSPHLREIEPGRFVPAWPEAAAAPEPPLPPLTAAPAQLPPPPAPLLANPLPDPADNKRISPLLSYFLKGREHYQAPVQRLISVPHPLAPPLKLDSRKWPGLGLTVIRPDQLGEQPPGSVSLLHTPFQVPSSAERAAWLTKCVALLDDKAWWLLLELLPLQMPGHWLFHFFPDAWTLVKQQAGDASTLYVMWQELGFEVKLTPQSYYQAVQVEAALALAEMRPAGSLLAQLPEEVYQRGLARLRSQPAGQMLPSQLTVAEIVASRGMEIKVRYQR